MNYIDQELLRQRAVLQMLFQGWTGDEKTEERVEQIPSDNPVSEKDSNISNHFLQQQLIRRSAANQQVISDRWGISSTPVSGSQTKGLHGGVQAETEALKAKTEPSLMVRASSGISAAWSAAELSRAVERDARRYDGAYLLY